MTKPAKKKIPHPKTAKSDADHIANMVLAAEQAAAGYYTAKGITVVQGDALPDGGVPLAITMTRYETDPSAPAA